MSGNQEEERTSNVIRRKNSIFGFSGISKKFSSENLNNESYILPCGSKNTSPSILKMIIVRQTLRAHEGPVWVVSFDNKGHFMASGGEDCHIYIWEMIFHSTSKLSEERCETEHQLVHDTPYEILKGHTKDILSISWSIKDHLLSSSMDKTIRLWDIHSNECLQCFQHAKCVTSVSFHPKEDCFISGSSDRKIRLWDTKDGRVKDWALLKKPITVVSISPCGEKSAVGLAHGEVYFFQTKGMKYYTEIQCRNRFGQYKKGTKVTGLKYLQDGKQLLVTTNDSRCRIFCLIKYTQLRKFKGNCNESLMIGASISTDERHILCGSEDGFLHLWETHNSKKETTNSDCQRFRLRQTTPPIINVVECVPRNTINQIFHENNSSINHSLKLLVIAGVDGLIQVLETIPSISE